MRGRDSRIHPYRQDHFCIKMIVDGKAGDFMLGERLRQVRRIIPRDNISVPSPKHHAEQTVAVSGRVDEEERSADKNIIAPAHGTDAALPERKCSDLADICSTKTILSAGNNSLLWKTFTRYLILQAE